MSSRNRKAIISLVLILIIVFTAFYPSLKNGFVNWDDVSSVTANPIIQSFSLANIGKAFTTPVLGHYLPVTTISYLIEYRFFKLDPFPYHLTSLILHLLNCLLVFWLIYILSAGRIPVALLTAVLFGIHPLQVESVAWISERKNVLYAFFFLASIISYLYYLRKERAGQYYYFSLLLFILSLLSKSMAITLPLALLLLDYWLRRKRDRMVFLDKIPYFALSLFFGVIAIISVSRAGMIRHDGQYSLFNSLSVVFYGVVFYLNKIILPIKLSCFYPFYGIKNTFVNLYSFFVMAILIYGVILSGKYTKKIILGTAFFFITLIPALQLVPNGEIIVADRYVYISAIGIFYFISEGLFWLYSRKTNYLRLLRALVLVVLIGLTGSLMASTWGRCGVWKDSLSLWNDALANYPNAITPYINRGQHFFYNNEYDKALPDSICAMYLSYKYGRSAKFRRYFLTLGNLYRAKGRNTEAATIFENMIKFNPHDDEAYFNLANINDEIFLNKKEAAELYRKAIEINPNHASARYYLKKIQ